MTKEPYNEGLDIFRDSQADEDFRTGSEVLSADPTNGGTGTRSYPTQGAGQMGLDDSAPTPVTSDQVSDTAAMGTANGGTADAAASRAADVAGSAKTKAGDVAGSAADKAAELKDVAVERGGDVAAVAKDELARLAHDARAEVQSLWSTASGQVREQAATGQQQLAEMLHSFAGELGEMASKSENTGPLTALARQAAAKGGEWSHWLSNSEPSDVLGEVRRFARRRPFVFLASAALAGVVVGRLGRGLMAANDTDPTATRMVGSSTGSVPATTGVVTTPAVSYEEVPSFGTGEDPELVESYASHASAADPYGLNDGSAR